MLMGHTSKDTGNRVYNYKTIEDLQRAVCSKVFTSSYREWASRFCMAGVITNGATGLEGREVSIFVLIFAYLTGSGKIISADSEHFPFDGQAGI